MTELEQTAITIHADIALFREAVNLTAAETRFAARLIEKDYFCTVLLAYLRGVVAEELVFKGGTCLAKVHADFYRLSEDLDFVIPVATDSSRAERRTLAAGLKKAVAELPDRVSSFSLVEPLVGANNSTQYVATLGYESVLSTEHGTIKIEVALREPLLTPAVDHPARSILINPISHQPMVPPAPVRCISKDEAFAEKFRAALTRREPAIRDFYDIDYAVRKLALAPEAPEMISLIRYKLAIPGSVAIDVSDQRLSALRKQIQPQLQPVLRDIDFSEFDLDRAFALVTKVAVRIGPEA
jgi:predicted nucleotidyltransferase component of viral defense system